MFSIATLSTPVRVLAVAIAVTGVAAGTAAATDPASEQQKCAARHQGPYGFQCRGWVSVSAGLEPITFQGTVEGDRAGVYNVSSDIQN